ncbi:MAG: phospholipid-binding protein MlaC [Gammaproteobacteria bacterium]
MFETITAARRAVRTLLATLLLAVGAPATANEPETPLEVVRATVDGVIATLTQPDLNEAARQRQVRKLIGERFDFIAMSNRVLATNWSKASKTQRARFTTLFRELLTATYWRKISGYTDEKVHYEGERLRSDKLATVATVIETASVDIPVDYKLYLRDGRWMAYDVVIEQVSLVRNYRGSFQTIVHQSGIDGLIEQLEVKVAEASAEAAEE